MIDPMNTNPCRLCCRVKFDALPMRFPLTEPTEQLFTGDLQDFVGTTVETVGAVSGCKASVVYASDLGCILIQWCKLYQVVVS